MESYQQLHHPHGEKPSSPGSTGNGYFRSIRACPWLACGFLSLALLHLLCCSLAGTQRAVFSPLLRFFNGTYSSVSTERGQGRGCRDDDYSEGRWVREAGHARRYNGTECNVKDSENCVRNGPPDTGYLDWRWQPAAAGCHLPAFEAAAFLAAVRGKHVAFVGDSMARNQAGSLVCLLGASFPYRDPDPGTRKFWRWAFPSHGVTVSVYWAPFLAGATGRVDDYTMTYCSVHLDALAERWSAEAGTMDVAVVSIGHWFCKAAVYYHNGSDVLGAHLMPESNPTEIGFFAPFRAAIRTSVERLISSGGGRTVVLSTFSPSHFEKAWDDPTTCARTEPYKEGEKEVWSDAAELRRIVKEEAAAAAARNVGMTKIKVLDVTKLATMRPDGHPGVYMWRDPFARGTAKGLLNDCLHFCLPGPVDTFNEILLQLLMTKRQ